MGPAAANAGAKGGGAAAEWAAASVAALCCWLPTAAAWRRVLLAGAAAGAACAAAGAAACAWLCWRDEGTRRMCVLYRHFAPVVLQYRWLEGRHRVGFRRTEAAEWQHAHRRFAPRTLAGILRLRGFYIKVGQILAGRPDLMPEEFIVQLRVLEDAVPPQPGKVARSVVEEDLGVRTYAEVFSEWRDDVLGSASIGQVHLARLRSTGREVAVKVQYPGVERLFRADIKTFRGFCRIFAREQLAILDEIEKQFLTEFDYREEARNLDEVRRNLAPHFARRVVVPDPALRYCTRRVLVMEYLRGPKLYDAIRDFGERYAATIGTTFAALEQRAREDIRRGGFPEPYRGPGPAAVDAYRWLLALRDAAANAPKWVYNAAVAPVAGTPRAGYTHSLIPPNAARLMQTLLDVHAHQLLVDGCFNADPHAGNFLLLPCGRIGLIDYGQVKRLTKDERLGIACIYQLFAWGLERGDPGRLAEAKQCLVNMARQNGYVTARYDAEVCWNISRFSLDADGPEVCGGLNPQQFLDDQYARDPWSATGDFVVMPTRMSFMLRGVGLMLNHPVSVGAHFAPVAARVLAGAGLPLWPPLWDDSVYPRRPAAAAAGA